MAQLTQVESEMEQVRAMLAAVKEGIGAAVVGLFDDDMARLHATSEPTFEAFWDAFRTLPCLTVDWADEWYSELRWEKHATTVCTCGQHVLHTSLVHQRWALMVLADGPLARGAQGFMFSAALALAQLLPRARVRRPRRGGRGPEHARIGIPVWWVATGQWAKSGAHEAHLVLR